MRVVGGLTHIIFECPLLFIQNFNLYSERQKSIQLTGPINIPGIFHNISFKTIQGLYLQ